MGKWVVSVLSLGLLHLRATLTLRCACHGNTQEVLDLRVSLQRGV
jgi:hypothetical protein